MAKCKAAWYHGEMSSETASQICMRIGTNGAFLVRKSGSVIDAFALSLLFENEVFHHIITKDNRMFCMQATQKWFPTLEKVIEYYKSPQESFLCPLLTPITKKMVKQFPKGWERMTVPLPIYADRKSTMEPPSRIPLPTPADSFSSSPVQTRLNISKKEYVFTMSPSPTNTRKREDETFPKPPPPIVQPRPKVIKGRPKSTIDCGSKSSSTCTPTHRPLSYAESSPSYFTTFGKHTVSQTVPRRRFSLDDTSAPQIEETDEHSRGSSKQRSRTFRLPSVSRDYFQETEKKTADSDKPTFELHHLLRKVSKARLSAANIFDDERSIETRKPEPDNEMDKLYHTPIMCKTTFVTTTYYDKQDGAMRYQKGIEMLLKGVRVDGWWYCVNKTTKEEGWVLQENLKPKSEQEWFEAKPVETTQDYNVYQNLDELGVDDDELHDDGTYCRYLMPVESIK